MISLMEFSNTTVLCGTHKLSVSVFVCALQIIVTLGRLLLCS